MHIPDWCVKQNDAIDPCTAPIVNGVPLCHHDQTPKTTVPTPLDLIAKDEKFMADLVELQKAVYGASVTAMFVPPAVESPKARPRKERSAPVRNPAFRENEGLRELQKQLNSRK